jgi:hypothetical protein
MSIPGDAYGNMSLANRLVSHDIIRIWCAMRTRGPIRALARVEELKFVSIDKMPRTPDIFALFGNPRLGARRSNISGLAYVFRAAL